MADSAFLRSADNRGLSGGNRQGGETQAAGAFAAHTTADLIALRNELLEKCLDLESRRTDGGLAVDPQADPEPVRAKIDEIHEELALRDLAERLGGAGHRSAGSPAAAAETPAIEALPAEAAQKSVQILKAIEMRSRFMDELAQAAREQGHLDQAAAFTLNAQKLDLERVDVLRQLCALSVDIADTDE